jgi:putative nucleotidyltransferase with HDIG domain
LKHAGKAVRTLIIDNDAEARTALKMMLQGLSDCQEAPDRETALNLFRDSFSAGSCFDLVTLDLNLPDLSEESLLRELRTIEDGKQLPPEQKTCIFVITAQSGRQLEADCYIQGCDDFITKPLETRQLLEKLAHFELLGGSPDPVVEAPRVVSTAKILDAISAKLKRGDLQLPPAPKIAMKVRQLITCNAEIEDLVDLLKQDLSIATKLISVSNSAFYRGVTENGTLGQAVRRLGVDRSVEVVMSICCRGYFVTNHPAYKKIVEALWWHSLACAHTAELVARDMRLVVKEDYFSLGLLHDIGKLILIQVAADLDRPKKNDMNIHFEELQLMMDAHHRRFGAAILKRWGYSQEFVALIRHHRSKNETSPYYAMNVLHHADLLVRSAGYGLGSDNSSELKEALEQLGYSEQKQQELGNEIVSRMEQLRYTFG